jgi:hypothetical protein
MHEGAAIFSYPLNRHQGAVIEIPYGVDADYQVFVSPGFPCTIEIQDLGWRWEVIKVADPESVPSVPYQDL